MSQTIDSKVVEMRFDNAQFEQNVATSLTTLDKLKQALKLDGSTKALDNVSAAAKNIDLSSVSSGVEFLEKRFSTMGIIGMRVLQNLTDSAMRLGRNLVSGIWGTIMTKGKTRAFNIENAKFQLQGLFGDTEEGAAKVQEAMKNASDAVDGTAFGLDEAAKAASQFAASGVEVGTDMTNALLAISGTAAMTNSGFDDIARIFTTVAGNGRVMAEQLNQLSGRGLNAAAALTTYFNGVTDGSIEASESVQKSINEITHGKEIAERDLRDFVSKGLVSFDIFAEAMNKQFGEHAKAANKTVLGAMSNVKAALGRIGALFYSPLIEQGGPLVDLLNAIRVKINNIKTAIEPVAKIITDNINGAIQWAADMLDAFDLEGLLHLKKSEFKPTLVSLAKQARGYIKPFGDTVKETTGNIEASTDALNAFHNVVTSVIRGDWGNGQAREDSMLGAGLDYSGIQGYVNVLKTCTDEQWTLNDAVWDAADAAANAAERINSMSDEQLKAMGLSDEQVQSLHEVAKAAVESGTSMEEAAKNVVTDAEKQMGVFQLIGSTIFNVASSVIGPLKSVGAAFVEAFPTPTAEQIKGIFVEIYAFSKKLVPTEKTLNNIKSVFKGLFSVVGMVGDALAKIGGAVLPVLLGAFKSIRESFLEVLASFGEWIAKLREFARKTKIFEKIGNSISKRLKPAVELVTKAFSSFSDVLSGVITRLGDRFITKLPAVKGKIVSFLKALKETKTYRAVSKAVGDMGTRFSSFINRVKSGKVSPALQKLSSGLTRVKDALSERFSRAMERFPETLDKIGNKLSELWSTFKGSPVFEKIVEWGGKAKDALSDLGEWFIDGLENGFNFGELLSTLSDKLRTFFENFSIEDVKGSFKTIASKIKDAFLSLFSNKDESVTPFGFDKAFTASIEDIDIEKASVAISEKATSFWDIFKKKLSEAIDAKGGMTQIISDAISKIQGLKIQDVFKGIKALGILKAILNVAGILKGVKKLTKEGKTTFKSINSTLDVLQATIKSYKLENESKALWSAAKSFALAVGVLVGAIFVLGSMPPEQLNQGLNAVKQIALIIGALMVLKALINKISGGGGGTIKIANPITDFLGGLASGLTEAAKKFATFAGIGVMFAGVGIGIKFLVDALKTLMTIEWGSEKVNQAVLALTIMAGGIVTAAMLLKKVKGTATIGSALSIVAMAAAINLLIPAIKKLGEMDSDTLAVGLVSVIGLLLSLAGAMRLAGGRSTVASALSLVAMTLAIKVLVSAVKSLGSMDNVALLKGLTSIVLLLISLGGAIRLAGGNSTGKSVLAILAMSGAILILTFAIKQLAEIKTDKLLPVVLSLVVLIAALGLAIKAIGKAETKPASIIALGVMVGAIWVLVLAIQKLSGIKASSMIKSLMAIGVVIAALVLAFKSINKKTKDLKSSAGTIVTILAMTAMLGIVALAIYELSKIPLKTSLTVVAELCATLLAVSGSVALLNVGGIKGGLIALANFAIFVGGLILIAKGIEYLDKRFDLNLLESLKNFGSLLGTAIGEFIGSMGEAVSGHMVTVADDLSSFAEKIQPFLDGMAGVNGDALNGIASLSDMMLKLSASTLMDSISEALTFWKDDEKSDVGPMTKKLQDLATGMAVYAAIINLAKFDQDKIDYSIHMGEMLAGLNDSLPPTGGVLQYWVGEKDLGKFGWKLLPLAVGMAAYAAALSLAPFDETKVEKSIDLAKMLAGLNGSLPETGGKLQKWMGEKDLGTFGWRLLPLAAGMAAYAVVLTLAPFDETKVKKSIDMAKMLAELNNSLPSTGGKLQKWMGEKDLGTFGWRLLPLATGMAAYATILTLAPFDETKVEKSINMAKMLAELNNMLPPTGGELQKWIGEKDLGKFGWNLIPLATGMAAYATILTLAPFDETKVEKSITLAKMLAGLNDSLPETGGHLQDWVGEKDLASFGMNLIPLATGMATYAAVLTWAPFDEARVEKSINLAKMLAELNSMLPPTGGKLQQWVTGEQDLTAFGSKLTGLALGLASYATIISFAPFDIGLVAKMTIIALMLASIDNIVSQASAIGGDAGLTTFIEKVPSLGTALTTFANNIDENIEQSKVDKAVVVAQALADVEALVAGKNGMEGILGTFNKENGELNKFGDGLVYLGTCIGSFSQNCSDTDVPAIKNTLDALSGLALAFNNEENTFSADSFTTFVDELNKIGNIDLTAFVTAIQSSETDVKGAVEKLLKVFPDELDNNSETISTKMSDLMTDLVAAIQTKDGDLKKAATADAEAIEEGLTSKNDSMSTSIGSTMQSVVSSVRSYRGKFNSAGSSLAGGLKQGLDSKNSNMGSNIGSAIQKCISTIRTYRQKFYDAGVHIVAGLNQGIDSQMRKAQDKMRELAGVMAQATKMANQIKSPSKLYRKFGQYIVEGLVLGIEDETQGAVSSMENLSASAIDGFSNAISTVSTLIDSGMDFTPTIRPVLDLTEIQNGVNQANSLFGERTMRLANVVADDMSVRNETSISDSITDAVKSAIGDAMAMTQEQGDLEPYVIEVPVNIDGREVARVTAPFTRSELTRLDVRANRKVGIVGV